MATNSFTATDIQNYAKGQGLAKQDASGNWVVDNDAAGKSIFEAASKFGVSGQQLDNAFGWSGNTAQSWASSRGLGTIGAQPAPAPRTDTVSTDGGQGRTPPPPAPPPATTAPPPPAPAPATKTPEQQQAEYLEDMYAKGYLHRPAAPPPVSAPAAPAPAPAQDWASIFGSMMTAMNANRPPPPPPPPPPKQIEFNEAASAAARTQQIISQGGALMQQAEGQGLRNANSRGVLNSSAAARSAQQAVIAAASDLAKTDANNYASTEVANMNNWNQYTSAGLDRAQRDYQFRDTMNFNTAKMAQESSQFDRQLAESGRQFDVGNSTQLKIADMNYNIQDRRLTQDDKQFIQSMALEQRKLDTQIDQFAKQFGLSERELGLRADQLTQQDRQFYDDLILRRDQLRQQGEQFNTDWQNRFTLQGQADAARVDLAKLDGDIRRDLMNVEASYRKDIAANENISGAWGTMMQEIGRIQNNPDLDSAAKETNIQNALNSFRAFTNTWKKISGSNIDVSDLLSFGITNVGGGSGGGSGSGATGSGNSNTGSNPNQTWDPDTTADRIGNEEGYNTGRGGS